MNEHITHLELLRKEKYRLETELNQLGVRNKSEPNDWEATARSLEVMPADENELADQAEEASIDSIVSEELQTRYKLICRALEKFDTHQYGTCEVCGSPIEEDRLDANPAARTCKAHLGREDSLLL